MRTIIYGVLGVLAVAVLGGIAWAMTLPAETTASRSTRIAAPIDKVFGLVTDIDGQAGWRRDVERVEIVDAGASWTEHTTRGMAIDFREERKEPGLYAISFTSPQGFSGRWEGRFAPDGDGTAVDITETVRTDGFVARVMGRLFAPPGAHIDLYLGDLKDAAEARP